MVLIPRNRKGARKGFQPKKAKGLTKVQKTQVRALVVAPAETKYVSEFAQTVSGGANVLGFSVLPNVISGGVTSSAWQLIPRLAQSSVAANQSTRVGNKVSNVTLRADFQFWINSSRPAAATADYMVRVFILKAKRIKSNFQIVTLPTSALLDNGDSTSIDWTPSTALADKALAMYPINKEVFTVCKTKTFRLCVNQGGQTGDPTVGNSPLTDRNQHHEFSYTCKHKSNLVYVDNNIGTTVPENLNLFCFAVVWDANANAAPYTSGNVQASCRTHMWFKDM